MDAGRLLRDGPKSHGDGLVDAQRLSRFVAAYQTVTALNLGELWASAQLSYESAPLHPAQESARVGVPGEFAFAAPGIKIPPIGGQPVEGAAAGG